MIVNWNNNTIDNMQIEMSDFQVQLAEARKKRAAAFEATQAYNAAEAETKKRQQKLQQLLQRAAEIDSRPPIDRPASVIGRFVRRCSSCFGTGNWVEVEGQRYPLDVAFQMAETNLEPFNSSSGKLALDRKINSEQNKEYASSLRLNEEQRRILMLVSFVNSCELRMETVVFPEFLMELMIMMEVVEPEELIRRPFVLKDEKEKNGIAFWFRVFVGVQCHSVPDWVGGTSEEWMVRASAEMIELIGIYNKNIAYKQQRMEEMFRHHAEDEEVKCGNSDCGRIGLVRDMYRREGASFFFCRNCAPLIGIDVPFPQNDFVSPILSRNVSPVGSPILSTIVGLPRSESALSLGSDLEVEQDI